MFCHLTLAGKPLLLSYGEFPQIVTALPVVAKPHAGGGGLDGKSPSLMTDCLLT
jgi:hypothetical protein